MINLAKRSKIFLEKEYSVLINSNIVNSFVKFSRKLVIPGFDGMPLYDIGVFFIKGIRKGAISMRAAAFSYNFFLALFPAIIFFFTIIPYIPIAGFQDGLLEFMRNFIPRKTFDVVEETLFDIVKRPRGGLLSIGFIMAMYFSTNGIHSLIESFNQTRHTIETRSWIKQRLISIVLVMIISVLIIISIVLISLGPLFIDFLIQHGMLRVSFSYYLIIVGKWVISAAMLFFAFSFLYYMAPAAVSRYRFISPGSTLSTILTIFASVGFNYYVNSFSKYNTLYGSIGTLIILLVWIYFNAMIVLIGFELNASIKHAKSKKTHLAGPKLGKKF